MEVQIAVCGIILKRNRLLLLKRSNSDEFAERGAWTFPGGRVKRFEAPDNAILREVKEETDLDVEVLKPLKIWSGTKGTVWRVGIDYLCKFLNGNVKLSKEHDDYVWASFDELDGMKVEKWIKENAILARKETTKKSNSND